MRILLLVLVATALGQADAAREAQLKLVGEAVKDFCLDHDGRLPDKLADLVREGYLDVVPTGVAPAAKRWKPGERVALVKAGDVGFHSDGTIAKAGAAAPPRASLGLKLRDTNNGVEIVAVESALFKEMELRPGDRIAVVIVMDEAGTEKPVTTVKALHEILRKVAGKEVLLLVRRGEEEIIVPLAHEENEVREEGDLSLDACLEQLARGDPEERAMALAEIALFGAAALPALPRLLEALADKDDQVRAAAAGAIGGIGAEPGTVKAIPALTKTIRDPVADVRLEAARTLREIAGIARGDERMQALAALHEAAQRDKDPRVREAATVR